MSKRDLVPQLHWPTSVSYSIVGIILGIELVLASAIFDVFTFHHQSITTNAAVFAAQAEVAVAAGILLEVWVHYREVVERKRPHADPPTLALTVHTSAGDLDPAGYGPVLAVTNFGPGIAKDLTLEWFAYPMTDPAKAYFRGQVGRRATSGSTIGRAALSLGEQRRWILDIPRVADVSMEYVLEFQAYDLLGAPMPRIQYQIESFQVTSPPATGSAYWAWQIRLDPLGRPVTPGASIAELRQRAEAVGEPHFWPLD